MDVDDLLTKIENAFAPDDLHTLLSGVARELGYCCTSYVDIRRLPLHDESPPFFVTDVNRGFLDSYRDLGLLGYDPVVNRAATTNFGFSWSDVGEFSEAMHRRGVKSRAHSVFHIAHDHGYREGYVVPLHAVDADGYPASALVSFYWGERVTDVGQAEMAGMKTPYWLKLAAATCHQRMLDIRGISKPVTRAPPSLTDREREILVWACRGKTRFETAEILGISERTVKDHWQSLMSKLGVHNKYHAIAVAVSQRLIAP